MPLAVCFPLPLPGIRLSEMKLGHPARGGCSWLLAQHPPPAESISAARSIRGKPPPRALAGLLAQSWHGGWLAASLSRQSPFLAVQGEKSRGMEAAGGGMLCATHVAPSLCRERGGRRWGSDLDCNQAAPRGAAGGVLMRFLLSNLASAARCRDLCHLLMESGAWVRAEPPPGGTRAAARVGPASPRAPPSPRTPSFIAQSLPRSSRF